MKNGDLAKFIEEAARRRVLHSTVQEIKARNGQAEPAALEVLIDQAVREVRKERNAI